MSNKTRLLKSVNRKLAEDLLSLPFWERFKIAVNLMFKKIIFITK